MADNASTFGDAVRAAIRAVRLDPKLPHLATTSDPEYAHRFQCFMRLPPVRAHLRTFTFRRWEAVALDLLDRAAAFLDGGEAELVHALYLTQEASGVLAKLSDRQRETHRAIFMLAVSDGSSVLASTRFLAVVVGCEAGYRLTPVTATRYCQRFHDLDLLEYVPGVRSPGRSRSGRLLLDLSQADPHVPFDGRAAEYLTLSDQSELALREYVVSCRRAKKRRL